MRPPRLDAFPEHDVRSKQRQQQRILGVHAELRLIERDRARTVENIRCHLIAAVSGKAVHESCLRTSALHELGVHLIRSQACHLGFVIATFAHRYPHIGVDRIHAFHCREVIRTGNGRSAAECSCCCNLQNLIARSARVWRDDLETTAKRGDHLDKRIAHIVSISDPGDVCMQRINAILSQGGKIGERLAGVVSIGECIDHRHIADRSKSSEQIMRDAANDDCVDPPRQILRRVFDALALPNA